jgi:predicted metalloprotease
MVLAIVMAVVLGVIGVAIVKPEIFRTSGTTTSAPTAKSTAASTSESRTTTTRSTRTTTARTTTSTSTTPSVQPTPTGEVALGGNPILQVVGGMSKQICSPPGSPSDEAASKAFYNAALPCLERGWQPMVQRAELKYDNPALLVPTGITTSTPCGSVDTSPSSRIAAFYCSTNQTMYMPLASDTGNTPIESLTVFAHEFGHHIQELTGTLEEGHRSERRAGSDTPAGLEISRRTELQAQCFSGQFIEAIVDSGGPFTRADYDAIRELEGRRGDRPGEQRTHGTPQSSQFWWTRGSQSQISLCNTWLAPSGEVA